MQLLTIPKAAAELGVSAQTLHRWRRDGKFEAERNVFGHWIVDLDSIPRDLVDKARALSEWRRVPTMALITRTDHAVPRRSDQSEVDWLKERLEVAMQIIDRLSSGGKPAED